jgi:hypothetical protein
VTKNIAIVKLVKAQIYLGFARITLAIAISILSASARQWKSVDKKCKMEIGDEQGFLRAQRYDPQTTC